MSQTDFRLALLDPGLAVPEGLTDPQGRPAGRRFSVYRNNVAVGLTDALRNYFPVVHALVGEEFFAAMAGVFLRAHPPASPVLITYGAELPGFLAVFPPVAHLGYLPDIARLELAIRDAYHAADAAPVAADTFAAMAPGALASARIRFAPAVRLIRSAWPIHAIWSANRRGTAPPAARVAEDVLVVRPAFDPEPRLLPAGSAAFLSALIAGATLADALDAANPGFEPTDTISLLLGSGAIVAVEPGDAS